MTSTGSLRCNSADGPWLVQTFGGAGLARHLDTIAGDIIPTALASGHRLAIVCAARAGAAKSKGADTTNLLLRAAHEALHATPSDDLAASIVSLPSRPPSPPAGSSPRGSRERGASHASQEFNPTVNEIKRSHLAACAAIKDREIRRRVEDEVEYECEKLRTLLMAAQIIEEMSPRSKDLIVGVGERLSARLLTAVLQDRGIDAEMVSLQSIVPEPSEEDASDDTVEGRLSQSFYDRVAKRIAERLAECGTRVPVIAGFVGPCPGGLLAQVGRGYSDLTAALTAVGLGAAELQAWKLVDGIFTADPRQVPTARLLATISPEEAAELTFYGARFLNPLTAEQALRVGIPVRIVNVTKPRQAGTVITPAGRRGAPSPVPGQAAGEGEGNVVEPRGPTAVTIKHNVLVLSIKSNRKSVSHLFYSSIFGALDRHSVIVDLVSTSEVHLSLAINGSKLRQSVLNRLADELKAVGEVTIQPGMACITLVGKAMTGQPGSFARMFSCLTNINLHMISVDSSQINVSCIVDGDEALAALRLVHDKLLK